MRRRRDERRLEDKTRRKRDVFCRALKCAQREFEDPLLAKKGIERGNASAAEAGSKRAVGCPTRDRNTIRRADPPPQISLFCDIAEDMSSCLVRRVSAQLSSRSSDEVSKSMCVCAMPRCRGFRVEWNRAAGLTKSRRDYDDSWLWQIPLRRYRSLNAIAISRSLRSRPCCGWNITPVDIVSARNGNQLYAPGKLRRDIAFGNISGRFFGYSVPREVEKYRYRKMLCCVNIVVMNAIIYL